MKKIKINGIVVDEKRLRFKKPIELTPTEIPLSATNGKPLFKVEIDSLRIIVIDETESKIEKEVRRQLRELWNEYAEIDDYRLDDSGIELKGELNNLVIR